MVKQGGNMEKMEKFRKQYIDIIEEAMAIHFQKAKEYDASKTVIEKMLFGLKSFIHELNKEVERLKSIEKFSQEEMKLCEFYNKLLDTVYDGINYFAYLGIYVKERCDKYVISSNPADSISKKILND